MTAVAALDGPPMPAPKFATPRDPSRPTLGTRQGRFARDLLGQPFMPHQQLVADVAGELVQNELGLWVPARSLVVVTMQRQAGKSHLALSGVGERCFSRPGYRAWYTAQTGQDARDQFLKFEEENVRGTNLEPFVKFKRGRGEEIARFANGATLRPHPPTEEKLHGKQSDRNDIDEGWAFEQLEGQSLLQAIGPTQLTRPGAQTWVWSAGGTAASTWLAELVARGRAGDPAIAYFEWAIPDDADAEDLDTIIEHHPAAGRTITRDSLAALRAQFGNDAAGWARAAGNRWTEIIGGAIRLEPWQALATLETVPTTGRVGYGAARSADGSQVAIVSAVEHPDTGHVVVEVLEVLPTAYKAADHILGWAIDGPLAVPSNGPSAGLYADLAKTKTRSLMQINGSHESAAVTAFLDAIDAKAIRHRNSLHLNAAVEVAGTRVVGDGGIAWARVAAGAPIATLEAAGLAVHALHHGRKRVGKPRIIIAA